VLIIRRGHRPIGPKEFRDDDPFRNLVRKSSHAECLLWVAGRTGKSLFPIAQGYERRASAPSGPPLPPGMGVAVPAPRTTNRPFNLERLQKG